MGLGNFSPCEVFKNGFLLSSSTCSWHSLVKHTLPYKRLCILPYDKRKKRGTVHFVEWRMKYSPRTAMILTFSVPRKFAWYRYRTTFLVSNGLHSSDILPQSDTRDFGRTSRATSSTSPLSPWLIASTSNRESCVGKPRRPHASVGNGSQ